MLTRILHQDDWCNMRVDARKGNAGGAAPAARQFQAKLKNDPSASTKATLRF